MTLRFPPPGAVLAHPVRSATKGRDLDNPLTLGFLCPHNPYDRRAFSGSAYFAAHALAERPGVRLRVLGPHRPRRTADRLRERLFHSRPPRPVADQIDLAGLDGVVGLVASPLLDQIRDRITVPFLHVTDATPGFLRDVYGWDVPQKADAIERRVVKNAAATLYSSAFMAARAQDEMGPGITTHVAPFGINFDRLPGTVPVKPGLDRLRLLFVCSDWARKGGDMALATVEKLRAGGLRADLTVAGRVPDQLRSHPAIISVGYLDKNRPRDVAKLAELYARSHLLLLPSQADCTPMVVAEALAHGTPVLASDTGGMASLIAPGTGRIMPSDADAATWAGAVRALTGVRQDYFASTRAAFEHAGHNMTWAAWAQEVEACAIAVTVKTSLPKRAA